MWDSGYCVRFGVLVIVWWSLAANFNPVNRKWIALKLQLGESKILGLQVNHKFWNCNPMNHKLWNSSDLFWDFKPMICWSMKIANFGIASLWKTCESPVCEVPSLNRKWIANLWMHFWCNSLPRRSVLKRNDHSVRFVVRSVRTILASGISSEPRSIG